MTFRQVLGAVLIAVLGATACTSEEPPAATPPPSGVPGDVAADRERLGQPTVDLAEAMIKLADDVDAARFEVPRGEQMRDAVNDLADQVDAVNQAADAAETAAADASVTAAGRIVDDAVETARHAAAAGEAEVRYLRQIARIDRRLLAAAADWDRPGSQSELRAFLGEVAEDVAQLRRRARRLRPAPDDCTVMKANRRQWVRTVHRRTLRLAEQANSAGGSTYDDLRDAYRRLPFGDEPRAADGAERACWEESSALPTAADALRDAVDALEQALR